MSEAEGQEPENTDEPEAVEPPKLSYEELEAELARTRNEAKTRRLQSKNKDAELEEFRNWKKSQLTEAERLKQERDELQKEISDIRREALQRKVASKAGLDPDFADRIRGDSEEDMLEDAKRLAKKAPAVADAEEQKPSKPTASGMLAGQRGKPVGSKSPDSPKDWLNDLLRGPNK